MRDIAGLLFWTSVSVGLTSIFFMGLVVLGDVLTYMDLRRRLKVERGVRSETESW